MRFIALCKSHAKRKMLFPLILGFLPIMFLSGPVFASGISSSGTAFIDWSTLNVTLGGSSFNPVSDGFGVPSAFSGSQVQLNGTQTDFGGADYGDGSLPTSSSASLSNPNLSSVQAIGQTTTNLGMTNGLSASLTMSLKSPDTSGLSNGVPNQAQANLYDYGFTAPSSALLQVTVQYALSNSLSSTDPSGSVGSDVFAGLLLYGYDAGGNPLNDPLATAPAELKKLITGIGSGVFSESGLLTLTYNLTAGALYDLGGEVTATGQGASRVPEAATMLLLVFGLAGLGALKRGGKTA